MSRSQFGSKFFPLWIGVTLLLLLLLGGCRGISPTGLPSMEMTPENTMEALEEIEQPSAMETPSMHEGEGEAGSMNAMETMSSMETMTSTETMTTEMTTEMMTPTMPSSMATDGHHSHGAGTSTEMIKGATPTPESSSMPTSMSTPPATGSMAQPASDETIFVVEIKLFAFQMPELRIPAGATVVWRNLDDIEHTVTSGVPGAPDGRFDSGNFGLNQEFRFTFSEPGEYLYFCNRHSHMTGKVIVTSP
ncbi:cupredoxin domain-containing protein [Caldilinea aerophila]|jgi:plastocyanin|uniref:cupredoxin domain-containing protein n=1 Tax=Caldilinea aerophila TaxID=133453 RepID=UPI0009FC16EA|nr:plastocyanin/azurin family copper-binding protein [Caldilinea aerophila]